MSFTVEFISVFFSLILLGYPLLVIMLFCIIVMGLIVGKCENWTTFNAIYWSFITALTVGYGDIKPSRKISRVIAVLIALVGIMLSGIVVAMTVHSATVVLKDFAAT